MDRTLLALVVLAALAGLIYWQIRSRYAFVIRVAAGKASLHRGEVVEEYLKDVEQICKLWGFTEGVVVGVREAGKIKIRCAGGIAKSHRQAFQNAWNYQ